MSDHRPLLRAAWQGAWQSTRLVAVTLALSYLLLLVCAGFFWLPQTVAPEWRGAVVTAEILFLVWSLGFVMFTAAKFAKNEQQP